MIFKSGEFYAACRAALDYQPLANPDQRQQREDYQKMVAKQSEEHYVWAEDFELQMAMDAAQPTIVKGNDRYCAKCWNEITKEDREAIEADEFATAQADVLGRANRNAWSKYDVE